MRFSQSLSRRRPSSAQEEEASRATPRSGNKGRASSQTEATALKETKSSLEARKIKRRRVNSGRGGGRGYSPIDASRGIPEARF
jgi:hypothetical protein